MSQLNIISFNVPYPANYGGVIDVFYKIKALHALNVEIILHCFEYGRDTSDELEKYCKSVYYYKRKTGVIRQFSLKPYITNTRSSKEMLARLQENDAPILFEGLHSCYYLNHSSLKHRNKIVRMHNIEWEYYQHLAHIEHNLVKKTFFTFESSRLKQYQNILRHANHILAISPQDVVKLQKHFKNIVYVPAFHPNETVRSQIGKGNYILYHADLSVKDNEEGALFLIEKVYKNSGISMPLVIAGLNPTKKLLQAAEKYDHVEVKANLSHEDLQNLIHRAHINVLISFQSAGMKLKLLNAIFTGRFCLVNTPMVKDTGLEELCIVQDDYKNIRRMLNRLTLMPFQRSHLDERLFGLGKEFFNEHNAKTIVDLI